MAKHPRSYPPEFRHQIIELVHSGKTATVVAREFDLNRQTVTRRAQYGDLSTPAKQRHPSLRSGMPVHVDRLRQTLRTSRRASFDGIGGRLLRQRDVRELQRHFGMRAARSAPLQGSARSLTRGLRLHRRLLQPATTAHVDRLYLSRRVRTPNDSGGLMPNQKHSTKTGQLQRRETVQGHWSEVSRFPHK